MADDITGKIETAAKGGSAKSKTSLTVFAIVPHRARIPSDIAAHRPGKTSRLATS
jgi:hypothetical protein